ncbi:hypothetical protein [uncultured Devosia sp.]|uniref:DUF6894 family protein n=1 Tax=uncultured Devosia sp. TaxID=211434 RepID=UPI00260549C1|nr:hypothetical protein [uncultured Devosia sp.]
MPKYYFNVRQVNGTTTNETYSAEFVDDEAARQEAGIAISEMGRDMASLVGTMEFEVVVTTLDGREIARRWARFVADDYP